MKGVTIMDNVKDEMRTYIDHLYDELHKDSGKAIEEQSLYHIWRVMKNVSNIKEMLTALFYSGELEYTEFKAMMQDADDYSLDMQRLVLEIEDYSNDVKPWYDPQRKGCDE